MSSPAKEANSVGREMMIPYFTKVEKVYVTCCLLTRSVNIIPASAPMGVKNAPMLDPIIVLKIA